MAHDNQSGSTLPSALDDLDGIVRRAEGKRIAVFLDYDGTLTPIVDTPTQAVMAEEVRKAVQELARHCPVGIISGRDLDDLREIVRIDNIAYAGSHGFDIAGPDDVQAGHAKGEEFLPDLDQAEEVLGRQLDRIPGLLVERKKFAIAIHYRLVDPDRVDDITAVVDAFIARHPTLKKTSGKKIFEVQPKMDWHKGKALLFLLQTLQLDREEVLPIYIGDDVTDEDGFKALPGRGIGIAVQERPTATAASHVLRDPDEVRRFLLQLIPLCMNRPAITDSRGA
ncbi:trehalose-phosphatase [Desulfobulbus alkaliphilus]|uniref:trehalose-phosphatase n=1 Tax=Desulfobulbus alkaliphilus TaxID=869814 RepID=UPI00196471DD|nr:trehalose-phosphatase [Desulfobulbus alkaliphilus]MBM9537496.1 trehalose-phosphatase [Desulfobulbus alkaliphilus]